MGIFDEDDEYGDAYEQLAKELAIGQGHAEGLVHHMLRMGAGSGTMPVTYDGRTFIVTVEEATVKLKHPTSSRN